MQWCNAIYKKRTNLECKWEIETKWTSGTLLGGMCGNSDVVKPIFEIDTFLGFFLTKIFNFFTLFELCAFQFIF